MDLKSTLFGFGKLCRKLAKLIEPVNFKKIHCLTGDGWTLNDTVRLAQLLQKIGVDIVDCSSGGVVQSAYSPHANYQVPYAAAVRKSGVPSMAVGLITEPKKANEIIATGQADLVAVGRAHLSNPRWTDAAAKELGVVVEPVRQYRWTYKDLPPAEFVHSA